MPQAVERSLLSRAHVLAESRSSQQALKSAVKSVWLFAVIKGKDFQR
jgi:hypothetical protein